jgi:uncharacterized membrane protein
MRWEGYVRLACDEIRLAGAHSPQVARRLRAALEDLIAIAPEQRRPVLREQRELLDRAVRESPRAAADVTFALQSDTQGIGVAASTSGSASTDADAGQ